MIEPAKDVSHFFDICGKLDEMPGYRITQNGLMQFLVGGAYGNRSEAWISYEDKRMTGCIVFHHGGDLANTPTLYVIFLWTDPHHPELIKEYMELAENVAKTRHEKRISMTTARNAKAIERKFGRYGYQQVYAVIEKEVNQ